VGCGGAEQKALCACLAFRLTSVRAQAHRLTSVLANTQKTRAPVAPQFVCAEPSVFVPSAAVDFQFKKQNRLYDESSRSASKNCGAAGACVFRVFARTEVMRALSFAGPNKGLVTIQTPE
jgi:hypothetical protein